MTGGSSAPRRAWARLERIGQLRCMVIQTAAFAGLAAPWAVGHPVTAVLAWPLVIVELLVTLPCTVSSWRGAWQDLTREWQAGTAAKHRARILKARAKELEELTAEIRARTAALEAINLRIKDHRR